jgi:hypothetical protein
MALHLVSPLEPEVPPAGEEIHLPGPSLQPLGLAVGLTLAIVGVTLGPVLWVPGVLITLIVLYRWIRDARREMAELPLEHRH